MANISIKKDFQDGEELFAEQLNLNFATIEAGVNTANKIVWQGENGEEVVAFRGTTEEINNRNIIDGQTLYNVETGETYLDVGSERISTGAGNVVAIGNEEPTNEATKIWINPDEIVKSEVGFPIKNEYGEDRYAAYSCDYINNKFNSIIESGSNENGNWIKFADGTMICTRIVSVSSVSVSNAWGSMFYYEDTNKYSFAQEFIETPSNIHLTFNPTAEAGCWLGAYRTMLLTKSDFSRFALIRPTSNTVTGDLFISAIGRWK